MNIHRFPFLCNLAFILLLTTSAFSQMSTWISTNGPISQDGQWRAPFTGIVVNENNIVLGVAFRVVVDSVRSQFGIFRTTNQGGNWTATAAPYYSPCIASGSRDFFVGTDRVYYSSDQGISWYSIGLSGTILALAADMHNVLYALRETCNLENCGQILWRTPDTGRTWTSLPTGTNGFPFNASIAVSNPAALYYSVGPYLARSIDSGLTWTSIKVDTTHPEIKNIVTLRQTEVFLATDHGIFFSSDNGTSWQSRMSGLTDSSFLSILVVGQSDLIVGSYTGHVFHSSNNGLGWQPFNDGIAATRINDLAVDSLGYAYAATDSGVFRTTDKITGAREYSANEPYAFTLGQNFPNPFNPTTNISFSLPYKSFVSLKVFDVLGREVSVLLGEVLTSGRYSQHWNAGALPSGVYFYRLAANAVSSGLTGSFTETKKLLLLK